MGKKGRGKLLYIGIQGRWDDTLKARIKGFLICIFGCLIGLFFAIVAFEKSLWVEFVFFIIIFLFFLPFLIATGGLETDAIYENGITNRNDYLFKRLTGKSFHRFENITMIGYGQYTWDNVVKNFVLIFENNSIMPTCGSFNDKEFKNDFYERVVETLKVKCPNAKWQKVDFFKIPRRLR